MFMVQLRKSLPEGLTCGWADKKKNLPAIWDTWVLSLVWEDPLEKGKATHSSILVWRIPWTTVHGVAKSWIRLSDFHFLWKSNENRKKKNKLSRILLLGKKKVSYNDVCCTSPSVMSDSFVTQWTVVHHVPLSMGFPRQEYWFELQFPSPGTSPSWPRDRTRVSCISCTGRLIITVPPNIVWFLLRGVPGITLETMGEFMQTPETVVAKRSKPPSHTEEAEEGRHSSMSSLLWMHIREHVVVLQTWVRLTRE